MVEEIEVEAEEASCDLITIGTRIAQGLQRFMLTDTTEQIVLGSDRPVLGRQMNPYSSANEGCMPVYYGMPLERCSLPLDKLENL